MPPLEADKVVRGPRAKLSLALASLLVLAAGPLLAPPKVRTEPPRETVAPILQETVERREPARAFRGIQETGRAAAAFSVTFPAPEGPRPVRTHADFGPTAEPPRPLAGLGVVVSAEPLVLAHAAALEGRLEPEARLADGTSVPGRVLAHDPETGFVLVRLQAPFSLALLPVGGEPASPGELVILAARADGRDMVAPVFVISADGDRYTLSAAPGSAPPGTPVFGVDGKALAVVGAPPSFTAHAIGPTLDRLQALVELGPALPASIGVSLQDVSGGLARRWTAGALIADVRDGSPAGRAGLRPGDLVVGVAGAEVRTAEDALRIIRGLRAGEEATVAVRRRGKPRELTLIPEVALGGPSSAAAGEAPADAAPLRSVFPAALVDASGLPGDARVLSVEGARVSTTLPAALRRRGPPWLVRLQHGGRRFFAVLEAPR